MYFLLNFFHHCFVSILHYHFHNYLLYLRCSNSHQKSYPQRNLHQNLNLIDFSLPPLYFYSITQNLSFIIWCFRNIFPFHFFIKFTAIAINSTNTITKFILKILQFSFMFQSINFSFHLFLYLFYQFVIWVQTMNHYTIYLFTRFFQ